MKSVEMNPAKFIKSTKNKDLLIDSHDYQYRYKDMQKNKENPFTYLLYEKVLCAILNRKAKNTIYSI